MSKPSSALADPDDSMGPCWIITVARSGEEGVARTREFVSASVVAAHGVVPCAPDPHLRGSASTCELSKFPNALRLLSPSEIAAMIHFPISEPAMRVSGVSIPPAFRACRTGLNMRL